jgi:hypothetical protein|tara:strand:- start:30 stop:308 length:279 start_codon:yes stop_codon:yes gene_type:complete
MTEIKKIIKFAIEEINKQLPKKKNISSEEDFEILGSKSNFDSMALINFILIVEEKLKSKKKNLNLLNYLMEQMNSSKSYKISNFIKDIEKKL